MAEERLVSVNDTFLQEPVANLLAVRDDFLEAYAERRELGMKQNEAVGSALRQVVPSDQLPEVAQMLWGSLDQQLSINGRQMRKYLIRLGDEHWRTGRPPAAATSRPTTRPGSTSGQRTTTRPSGMGDV